MNKIFYIIAGMLLFSFSHSSQACRLSSAGPNPTISTVSFGNISVQRDAPVGTVLASKDTSVSSTWFIPSYQGEECYLNVGIVYNGGSKTSLEHTYSTNLDGVGIKVEYHQGGYPIHGYAENPPASIYEMTDAAAMDVGVATVSLVKTGTIKSGGLNPGEVSVGYFGNEVNALIGTKTYSISIDSSSGITQLACSLLSGSTLLAPIGNVSADQFTSPGTVSQTTSRMNIDLDCDAEANINITLEGTQNPDSADTSILALSDQGKSNVAEGIGVQLLYNNEPLKLNQRLSIKTSAGSQENFEIIARYIQTSDRVRAGSANATAVLNISYQ